MVINSDNNELVNSSLGPFIESNSFLVLIFYTFTPKPIFAFVPITSALLTFQDLFQQFMQTYLKDYRAFSNLVEQKNIVKRSLKAQNLNLYYENSYIEYYYFS